MGDRVDDHSGIAFGQRFGEVPVRGCSTSVQEPRFCQQGGAGADRDHPTSTPSKPLDMPDQPHIVGCRAVPGASGNDDGVATADVGYGRIRAQGQAGVAPDVVAKSADEVHVVRAGGAEARGEAERRGCAATSASSAPSYATTTTSPPACDIGLFRCVHLLVDRIASHRRQGDRIALTLGATDASPTASCRPPRGPHSGGAARRRAAGCEAGGPGDVRGLRPELG